MPIFTEDVIIRILTDSTQGVKEIKKVNTELKGMGGQAKLSAKSLASVGAAFGGVSAGIDLAVKAGTALITYLKEAEEAYVDLIKSSEDYVEGTNAAIVAIDSLTQAKERQKQVIGGIISESLVGLRVRRQENIELRAAFLEQASLEQVVVSTGLAFFGSTIASKAYQRSIIESTEVTESFSASLEEQIVILDALARRSEALNSLYSQNLDPEILNITEQFKALANQLGLLTEEQKINYDTSQALAKLDALHNSLIAENTSLIAEQGFTYAELSRKIIAAGDAKLALLDIGDNAAMRSLAAEDLEQAAIAEGFRIQFQYEQSLAEYKAREHQLELDRIEETVMASQQAFATTFSAFQNIHNSIASIKQKEFDAELEGLDKESSEYKRIRLEQWEAEKQAAKIGVLFNTAVAISRVWGQTGLGGVIAQALPIAMGIAQIAAINSAPAPKFALGTPPDGYVVPPGFEGDNFPVMAQSGETVRVTPQGQGGGETFDFTLIIDSAVIARITNQQISNRKINIRTSDLIA